ncbi:MAG TPA: hypothetical protein VF744_20830 [Beijerinckiaceae bacterium]|jgi:hypothetical protein
MTARPQASVLPFPLPVPPGEPRPPGTRRPHRPETVAAVRLLYERTCLIYQDIAARTGVSVGTITNWAEAGGWVRPPGAATARLRTQKGLPPHRLKGVALVRRLREIAERHVEDLEREPDTPDTRLGVALKMLEMAREEEQAVYRRRKSIVWRARVAAERMLDRMERDPDDCDKYDLVLVREMLWTIRDEEERQKREREERRAARAVSGGEAVPENTLKVR